MNTNEELIKNLYYDPNNAFISIKKLYDNLKQRVSIKRQRNKINYKFNEKNFLNLLNLILLIVIMVQNL